MPPVGTVEFWLEELARFRHAMCDSDSELDTLDKLFAGLFMIAANTKCEGQPPGWEALCVEWPLRHAYMEAQKQNNRRWPVA